MMRYEHPLIIYELDGVLADCAVREAAAEPDWPTQATCHTRSVAGSAMEGATDLSGCRQAFP